MANATCSADGCPYEARRRGMCYRHYKVWLKANPRPQTTEARFWDKVEKTEGGCWQWTAFRDWDGYGTFLDGVSKRAHRYAYELLVGPIPSGKVLDHLCRNTGCVNPDHLEPVSDRENVLRGIGPSAVNAAKTHCIHGHEFAGDNVHLSAKGKRSCRECARRRARLRYVPKADR